MTEQIALQVVGEMLHKARTREVFSMTEEITIESAIKVLIDKLKPTETETGESNVVSEEVTEQQ
jgi:hypothetical protein